MEIILVSRYCRTKRHLFD